MRSITTGRAAARTRPTMREPVAHPRPAAPAGPAGLPGLRRAVPFRQCGHAADGRSGAGRQTHPAVRHHRAVGLHHRGAVRDGGRRLGGGAGLGEAAWGARPIFLVAMAVLPVRGVLFTLHRPAPTPWWRIQLLDGVAAGIFGVISVLIASDLMRGTGRFNFAQGLMALSVGIGAALEQRDRRLSSCSGSASRRRVPLSCGRLPACGLGVFRPAHAGNAQLRNRRRTSDTSMADVQARPA